MSKLLSIDKVVKSVSITHKFDKPILKFLNTSDVENGKIINVNNLSIKQLKGQAKKTIKKHDILFSEIRPKNRRFAYVDIDDTYDFVVSTKLMVLRNINPEVDNKYFYYFLTNDHMLSILQDRAENRIGSFPQITFDLLSEYSIRVPHISEQKGIAAILSSIDSKIELNNRINAELEALAKTIYDYWFVQFDFPDKKGKPYKTSGCKMVWNEELKREIPEGWEVKSLDKCLDLIIDYRGKTPKKLNADWSVNSNDIIALSAKHVKNGQLINLENANRVSEELYQEWMKNELAEGDILLTSEAPCGEFFYLIGKTKYCLSQRLFAIRSNVKLVHHTYLYYELSKGNGISQILGKVSGSTVFGIRQDELRTVKILVPNILLQNDFANIVLPIFNQIRNNDYQNQQLTELRDWLLPMLMNGQVKVKEAEEMVSMAAEPEADYKKKKKVNMK